MPYVRRDGTNKIRGLYSILQSGYAEEFLPDDDAEVVTFRNPPPTVLETKKIIDITALGTRAEMIAEIDAMVGASPQVIAMIKKLAEIHYNNEKGTID